MAYLDEIDKDIINYNELYEITENKKILQFWILLYFIEIEIKKK